MVVFTAGRTNLEHPDSLAEGLSYFGMGKGGWKRQGEEGRGPCSQVSGTNSLLWPCIRPFLCTWLCPASLLPSHPNLTCTLRPKPSSFQGPSREICRYVLLCWACQVLSPDLSFHLFRGSLTVSPSSPSMGF